MFLGAEDASSLLCLSPVRSIHRASSHGEQGVWAAPSVNDITLGNVSHMI